MSRQRSLWVAVLFTAGLLGLAALRTTEAQNNQGLPDRVAALEKRVAALEQALKDNVVKSGDRVALKTKANLFIGATDGKGEVNTQTPGHPPREKALTDETFAIQRQQ